MCASQPASPLNTPPLSQPSPVEVQLEQLGALLRPGQPKLERLVHAVEHGVVEVA